MNSNTYYSEDLSLLEVPGANKVVIHNNVANLTCKSGFTTKILNNKVESLEINNNEVTASVTFNKEEAHIFNYLLDRANVTTQELFDTLDAANKFFDEYSISCKSLTALDKYISSLSRYHKTWTGLTSHPDYNLTLFANRTLPYYSLECMDWVKANIDALKGDYPAELLEAKKKSEINQGSIKDDYHEEINLATKNNNFLEWQLLPIDKYPNMEILIAQIHLLIRLNLRRQAITMICKLMLSPRECHIIRYPAIWDIVKENLENKDFAILIKYCMYYAMYILKQEETIMFSHINTRSRILFSLDEAHSLPTFDGCHIERSPYIVQLTDDSPLSQTMMFYLHGNRRINSKETFNKRLEIATGGAFKNIDFKKIGAAITGSILIPCVHCSPLEDGFNEVDWDRSRKDIALEYPYMIDTPTTKEDVAFANYLEYYYPSYVSLSDEDYTKQVLGIGNKLSANERVIDKPTSANVTLEYENDVDEGISDNTDLPPITPSPLTQEPAENKTKRDATEYNQLADIDISITTRDMNVFKERALSLYESIRKNCEHRGAVYIKEVKTIATIKYKVYGPGIPRPMDIFRIPYDPVVMVKKFHVNAVKMFYNGEVTILRSCVSCLLSGVGETYKWFSCNKIPADVLLKYAQRGISIILNSKERDGISNYITGNKRWGNIITTLNIKPKKIYCCVTKNHPFFRPGIYGCGIRLGLRKFERDLDNLYTNTLVVEKIKNVYPYGEVLTHDNKKIYMPNMALIPAILDHIDSENVVTDSFDNDTDEIDENSDEE
jgi:hypothetical protein